MTLVLNSMKVDAEGSGRGISVRRAVYAATTVAGNLNTSFAAGQVIDGVTLMLGNRILIKDQVDPIQNGIYIVTADTPIRALDMNSNTELFTAQVPVRRGNINGHAWWMHLNNDVTPHIVGVDPILFILVSGTGGQILRMHMIDTATVTTLAATSSIASATYNSTGGNQGVGQITGTLSVSDVMTIDGITYSAANNGTRILIKDELVEQVDQILTVTDLSGSLNSKYFFARSPTITYYIWYSVSGAGVDPAPGGVGVKVDIATNNNANIVRDNTETAMTTAINDLFVTRMSVPTNGLQINALGPVVRPSDGAAATRFSFSSITAGVSGASNGIYRLLISGTSFTLDRTIDYDSGSDIIDGTYIVVTRGNINHDTTWQLITNSMLTIGTPNGSSLQFIKTSAMSIDRPSNLVLGINAAPSLKFSARQNVILGNNAAALLTAGRRNVIIGEGAITQPTRGNGNTLVGYNTQLTGDNSTRSGCVILGQNSLLVESDLDNQFVVGARGSGNTIDNFRMGPDLFFVRKADNTYTNAVSNPLFHIPIPDQGIFAAKVTTAVARINTLEPGSLQIRMNRFYCTAIRNGASISAHVAASSGSDIESAVLLSGTLTVAATLSDEGNGIAQFNVTPNSSLGGDITIRYKVAQLSPTEGIEIRHGAA